MAGKKDINPPHQRGRPIILRIIKIHDSQNASTLLRASTANNIFAVDVLHRRLTDESAGNVAVPATRPHQLIKQSCKFQHTARQRRWSPDSHAVTASNSAP